MIASLCAHVTRREQIPLVAPLPPDQVAAAEARIYTTYPPDAIAPDARFWTAEGNFTPPHTDSRVWDDFFSEMVESTSTPGAEFIALGCASNGEAWTKFRDPIVEAVVARIRLRGRTHDWLTVEHDPWELFDRGYMSAVRPFIKNEPHKLSKIEEGRLRLIMNTSLIDLLVDCISLAPIIKEDLLNWRSRPISTGMGHDDESLEALTQYWAQMRLKGPLESSDVDLYDWTISRNKQAFKVNTHCYARRSAPLGSTLYHNIVAGMMLTFVAVLVLPDGRLVRIKDGTPWLSGRFPTANFNSYNRFGSAILAGAVDCKSMGDDAVEVNADLAAYAKIGWSVKRADIPPGSVEFCSVLWPADGSKPYLTTIDRTTFRLLQKAPTQLDYHVWKQDLRNHPQLPEYDAVVQRVWLSKLKQ